MSFSYIWAWCRDEDWVVLLPAAILLLTLLAISGLWYWLAFFGCVIGLVLGFEWMATKLTGLSISDQFRTWKKQHPYLSKAILFAAGLLMASLIFHLSVNI